MRYNPNSYATSIDMATRWLSRVVKGLYIQFLMPVIFCIALFSFSVAHLFRFFHISQQKTNLNIENAALLAIKRNNWVGLTLGKSLDKRQYFDADNRSDETIALETTTDESIPDYSKTIKGLCPIVSPLLVGWTNLSMIATKSHKEKEHAFTSRMSLMGLKAGGKFKPNNCYSRNKVALVVPFRRRKFHLKIFLRYMHPFLQRQQLQYVIFVIEQSDGSPFNRGMLMNIGYKEAAKQGSFQCLIFHDVDLLPEDDRNSYTCPRNGRPRQMAYAIDVYDYRPTPKQHLGGVSAFTITDFKLINGFSNLFWGWGSEDDDLFRRTVYHNLNVTRITNDQPSFANIVRYRMIDHKKEKSNPDRDSLLDGWRYRLTSDGLTDLRYKEELVQLTPLFTHIHVDIQKTS